MLVSRSPGFIKSLSDTFGFFLFFFFYLQESRLVIVSRKAIDGCYSISNIVSRKAIDRCYRRNIIMVNKKEK
jgi:hypothetical protein